MTKSIIHSLLFVCAVHAALDHELFLPWLSNAQSYLTTALVDYPSCEQITNATYDSTCVHPIAVVISECFDNDQREEIKTWINHLQALTAEKIYLVAGQQCALTWNVTSLQDNCSSSLPASNPTPPVTPESSHNHAKATSMYKYNHRMKSRHDQRKPMFPTHQRRYGESSLSLTQWSYESNPNGALVEELGRLLLTEDLSKNAVVLIATLNSSHYVDTWVEKHEASQAISFVISPTIEPNANKLRSIEALYEVDLLNRWNIPHLNVWYSCSAVLPNAHPLFYIDESSARQCECRCPVGYRVVFDEVGTNCVEIATSAESQCVFNNEAYTYEIGTPSDVCLLKNIPTIQHIPYPKQKMLNVSLTIVKDGSSIYSLSSPWIQNELERSQLLNDIVWSSPGKYMLTLGENNTNCEACLVILDRYRPHSTNKCPGIFNHEKEVLEFTRLNLLSAQKIIESHYRYSNDVVNDGCSDRRCDVKNHSRKDFFEDLYSNWDFDSGKTCLYEHVNLNITKQLTQPVFGDKFKKLQLSEPVRPYQCTRCCNYTTILQEYWTQFTCYSNSFERECTGTDPGCTTSLCLTALGSTLFRATVAISPGIFNASQTLVETLFPQASKSNRQVHIQLNCTRVDAACLYTSTIDRIFQVSSGLASNQTVVRDTSKVYVQWRYRLDNEEWQYFSDFRVLLFNIGSHKVDLEAWSQCGLVTRVQFDIIVYARASICVAEAFDTMWYQSSVRDTESMGLRTYKGSDFAELTFDYDPAMGVLCDPTMTTSPWSVTQVLCHAKYLNSTTASAPLVHRKGRVGPIIQRFAVYLKSAPTCFQVDCSFNFFSYGYNASVCANVSKLFVIERDEDYDDEPSSVCQGMTIKPFEETTVVNYVSTECGQAAQCNSMLSLPIDELSVLPSPSSMQDIFICRARETSYLLTISMPSSSPAALLGIAMLALACFIYFRPPQASSVEYSLLCDDEANA